MTAFLCLFALAAVHPVYAADKSPAVKNLVGKATVNAAAVSASNTSNGTGKSSAGSAGKSNAAANGTAGSRTALQATAGKTTAAGVPGVNTGVEDKIIPYVLTMSLAAAAAVVMGDLKIRSARKRSSCTVREEMEAFRRNCGM